MSTTSKKSRALDTDKIYDLLLGARTADLVTVHFKDGRMIRGALIFNQYKGTGRLINIDKEVSVDFDIGELRDLKF
jgi:hypothetical protein